jgi:hypothetical protein
MSSNHSPDNVFAKTPINGLANNPPEPRYALSAEERLEARVKNMPKDVGVMLLTVGLAGVVLPGVIGLPFLLAGSVIMMPKTTNKLKNSLGFKDSEEADYAIKQINRFLDDLDRRYPGTKGA